MKKRRKSKKGIALFSWLIFITALIVFNLALFNLYYETSGKIESVASLKPIATLGNAVDFIPNYLNATLEVAEAQAYIDYLSNIDESKECNTVKLNKVYFDINKCELSRDAFIEKFISNFNIDFHNYLYEILRKKSEKEEEGKFNAVCNLKESNKIYCEYEINKTFYLDYITLMINKKDAWEKDYGFESFDELMAVKEEIAERLAEVEERLKNNEGESKEDLLRDVVEDINGKTKYWEIEVFWAGDKVFISIKPKEAKLGYELNLVY